MANFDDKIVLVIGATGGIGSYVTRQIIEKGGKVIAFSKNDKKLDELSIKHSDSIFSVKGNATDFEDLKKAVNEGIEKFGKIDAMLHAVGSIVLKPIHALSEEVFSETLALNLTSPFLASKAVIPHMMKNGNGSVVVISSVAGKKGLVNHEAISAAKGGLESMIRSAAVTYAKKRVRFNAVALGLTDTPLAQFLTSNKMALQASEKMHPMGRIGSPEDVSGAIEYLLSDESKWTTGTTINIDGGLGA